MRDKRNRPSGPRRPDRPRAPVARPASRRSGSARSGAAARASAPRPSGRFTGRAIVLGVVLLALLVSYVFPVRVYLAQQAEIAALTESQDAQRERIAELDAEAARWEDDDYIRIQARKRLYFGEPGELLLATVWEDEETAPADDPDPAPAPERSGPWWDTVWTSIEAANNSSG